MALLMATATGRGSWESAAAAGVVPRFIQTFRMASSIRLATGVP